MKHLEEANMNYLEHFTFAFKIGITLIILGFIAILHGLIPLVFQTTVSDTIKKIFKC